MKYLIFLIVCWIPGVVAGQNYKYDNIAVVANGADYFSYDRTDCVNRSGSIMIHKRRILIDGQSYNIKKRKAGNVLKTHKGHVKLVYDRNHELELVHVLRFNTSYYYHIDKEVTTVASTLK